MDCLYNKSHNHVRVLGVEETEYFKITKLACLHCHKQWKEYEVLKDAPSQVLSIPRKENISES